MNTVLNTSDMEVSVQELSGIIDELTSHGRSVRLTVSGNSMYPLFRHRRDSVVLSPVTAPLKKGDIPFYRRSDGRYVLHRIIGMRGDEFVMCGDNQLEKEFGIYKDNIKAVVTGFYRDNKYYPLSTPWYRIYSLIWTNALPLRPLTAAALKAVMKIKHLFGE